MSNGKDRVSPNEYKAHRNKPKDPSEGSIWYPEKSASPVYEKSWVSKPKQVKVGVEIGTNSDFEDDVSLSVDSPPEIEAYFGAPDRLGDGVELDLSEDGKISTTLVLEGPESKNTLVGGAHEISVWATSESGEALGAKFTVNVVDSWQVDVDAVEESGVSYSGDSATIVYTGEFSLSNGEEEGLVDKLLDESKKFIFEQGAEWVIEKVAGTAGGVVFGVAFNLLTSVPTTASDYQARIKVTLDGEKAYVIAPINAISRPMGVDNVGFGVVTTDHIKSPKPKLKGGWSIDKSSFYREFGVRVITLNEPILLNSGRTCVMGVTIHDSLGFTSSDSTTVNVD